MAHLESLSKYVVMVQGRSQTIEVKASYFVPGSRVELVLKRRKLYDGYDIRKGENQLEVSVSLSPLFITNQTSATFLIPPGLKTSLYSLSLK